MTTKTEDPLTKLLIAVVLIIFFIVGALTTSDLNSRKKNPIVIDANILLSIGQECLPNGGLEKLEILVVSPLQLTSTCSNGLKSFKTISSVK
jgi:hypothetical protein